MNFLIRHIEDILGHYDASVPMSVYLKNHFKKHPKLGSRDRKAISEGTYLYFRFAKLLPGSTLPELIYTGLRHSGVKAEFLERMLLKEDPELPAKTTDPIPVPAAGLPTFSNGVTAEEWQKSLYSQPGTFIRARSGAVTEKLKRKGIEFTRTDDVTPGIPGCVGVQNGTDLEKALEPEDYVVQDWASQASMHHLLGYLDAAPLRLWDCCAGAGGKSLFLRDYRPDINILASDIRKSILVNLKERFIRYHLELPQIRALDGTDPSAMQKTLGSRTFDFVLCDAPCSGSGTWARTPEQYFYFEKESLKYFQERQLAIAANTLPFLKEGGRLAYVTCSVFREENEAVADLLVEKFGLKLVSRQLINGMRQKADTLFVAVLEK